MTHEKQRSLEYYLKITISSMMHLFPSFHPEVGNHINHTARHLSEGTKQLVLLTSFMPIRFILKATSKSHKNVSAIKATNDCGVN